VDLEPHDGVVPLDRLVVVDDLLEAGGGHGHALRLPSP
jgi:hypothetical protein